jgi:mannose-6-phosphate isomerase-like protein (cupin superfamily)
MLLQRWMRYLPTALATILALGWGWRESTFALEKKSFVASRTVVGGDVAMKEFQFEDKPVGQVGLYFTGETTGTRNFVTGRFSLDPGKEPHPPHTHVEEEILIVASGEGEIICDGKKTAVGPGSAMYTAPNVPHGIRNTGNSPLLFYFVKWTGMSR